MTQLSAELLLAHLWNPQAFTPASRALCSLTDNRTIHPLFVCLQVRSLAPLSKLGSTRLSELVAACNKIAVIESLQHLSQLHALELGGNRIRTIEGASGTTRCGHHLLGGPEQRACKPGFNESPHGHFHPACLIACVQAWRSWDSCRSCGWAATASQRLATACPA